MANIDLEQLQDEDFCYLTTTGRVSGRAHTIEIWFAIVGKTLYMLAGGGEKSDWVKNVHHHPQVQIKIGESIFHGLARVIAGQEEDALARKLLLDKYTPRSSDDLIDWSRISLPIAVDLND